MSQGPSQNPSQVQFNFKGKSVVVTGGAQGIGFQIAQQFLTAGAQVSIWDYSQDALNVAQKELSAFTSQLHLAKVDVTQRESVAAAATSVPWSVDVLINNAGITRDKSFAKLQGDDWDSVIATNLTGLFNVTKGLFEKFTATSQHKRIINISSVVGLYGNFGQSNYAAAKSGVIGLTKTWAKEFSRKGWTVNAVAPGFIMTAMTKAMPKEVLDQIVAKVPAARMGLPSDIASACLFLGSDQASYITGTVISVDGGVVL